jgi:CRISPR-associated exonuclease Cas4
MSAEIDSIPLSALQHYAYCPRQCALIHVERAWAENTLTAEGRVLHERTHEPGSESRRDLRIARALSLQSTSLGIHGVADVVEFHYAPAASDISNLKSQPPPHLVAVNPVEYKRGRPKFTPIDAVQLCAQALCLEEMLHHPISCGALFYGETRRRQDVVFDDALRAETRRLIAAVRAMLATGLTPPADYEPRKCRACSLRELCQPQAANRSASAYLSRLIAGQSQI